MDSVLQDIRNERLRQEAKWGDQSAIHLDTLYGFPILIEEVGEAAKAWLESFFGGADEYAIYTELIQVAAVAAAMAEKFVIGEAE
jgi:hypothetical protein